PGTPHVAASARWLRPTVVSIPLPPSEVSIGMKGEPVCPTPYTVRCSASNTARQAVKLSRAAHGPPGEQPYIPAAMLRLRPASVESNWLKKSVYRPSAPDTPASRGFSPRFAPLLASC